MSADAPSPLDDIDAEPPVEDGADSSESTEDVSSDAEGAEGGAADAQQRRRELREFEVNGSVTVNGSSFPLQNWSSSGFGVSDCDQAFEENERIDIDFSITLDTGPLSFSCKAIVVRSDVEGGNMAGAFVEMRREDRILVTKYFDAMENGDPSG